MKISDSIVQFNDAVIELRAAGLCFKSRTPDQPTPLEGTYAKDFDLLLDAVAPLLDALVASRAQGDRSGIASNLSPDGLAMLHVFAYYSSVLAVDRDCPVLIEQGLAVLTILGEVDDTRDLMGHLAMLYHSATKLGVETPALFAKVACLASTGQLAAYLRDWMAGFPLQLPQHRDLAAFNLREITTAAGLRYQCLPRRGGRRYASRTRALTLLFRRMVRAMKRNWFTKYTG